MNNKLIVHGTEISVTTIDDKDYISLTDMLRAKDGDFFISDWLRNRNTVEFLGIWEQIHNPDFKASPHNCVCGLRPIFCPIRAVIKGGNTYSIPALL